jgi:GxxExxY protein
MAVEIWSTSCFSDVDMQPVPDDVDSLTERVIGCAIAVHRTLGPGLLESIYRECLMIELAAQEIRAESGRRVILTYRGQRVATHLELDVLAEDCLVIEIKAVEQLLPIHQAQVITYLKLSGYPAGLLLNFNSTTLRAGLKRLDHPDRYVLRKHR